MLPTLAAFNLKSSSNDQDGPSLSTLEENIESANSLPVCPPTRRNDAFNVSF